ncbi:DUF3841 domain-containing protein [Spirosoma harenae]
MAIEKTYRLWTFQSGTSILELKNQGIIQPSWDSYLQTGYFIKSYRWIANQMTGRGIHCITHAPVWAWHSCTNYKQAPKLVDARCLLSDLDIEGGIQTIEFECPAELALLSRYGVWNMMLSDIFWANEESKIDKELVDKLFATKRKQFRKYDSIQATLPYLKLDWVKEIRDLNLRPNDFTYNADEDV